MEAGRRSGGWTWAEFARLPSEGGTRHEVVAGELVVTPAPSPRHQAVVTALTVQLDAFVRAHELGRVLVGPVDVLLGEGDYLEPDVVVVLRRSERFVTDRGIEGPPDLVVEVVSLSTAERDRGTELERYREHGVPECWIVDPDAGTIEVFRLGAADERGVHRPGDALEWDPGTGPAILVLPVEHVLD